MTPAAARATGLLQGVQRRRCADRSPTCTWRSGSVPSAARRTIGCCSPRRSWCAGTRHGSVVLDLADAAETITPDADEDDVAPAPRSAALAASGAGLGCGVRGEPAGHRVGRWTAAADGAVAAVARPVLAAGGAGRGRPVAPQCRPSRRPRSREAAAGPRLALRRFGRGGPAARGRRRRAVAGERDRRWTGHRQDHHGRPADRRAAAATVRTCGSRWRHPPGKAAARLEEAVRSAAEPLTSADRALLARLSASTLHRLLGSRPGVSSRFRHDRNNRLPYDVVVVDESSMVSLTLMARLLEALAPATRLVLVGDPDQLASVEAGAVLGDLVDGGRRRTLTADDARRLSARFRPEGVGGVAAHGAPVRDALLARSPSSRRPSVLAVAGRPAGSCASGGQASSSTRCRRRPGGRPRPWRGCARRSFDARRSPGSSGGLDRWAMPHAASVRRQHRLLCAHRNGHAVCGTDDSRAGDTGCSAKATLAHRVGTALRRQGSPCSTPAGTSNDYMPGQRHGVVVLRDGKLSRRFLAVAAHRSSYRYSAQTRLPASLMRPSTAPGSYTVRRGHGAAAARRTAAGAGDRH